MGVYPGPGVYGFFIAFAYICVMDAHRPATATRARTERQQVVSDQRACRPESMLGFECRQQLGLRIASWHAGASRCLAMRCGTHHQRELPAVHVRQHATVLDEAGQRPPESDERHGFGALHLALLDVVAGPTSERTQGHGDNDDCWNGDYPPPAAAPYRWGAAQSTRREAEKRTQR